MLSEIREVIARSSRVDERRSRYTVYVSWAIIPVVFLFPLFNDYTGLLASVILAIIGVILCVNLLLYMTNWRMGRHLIPFAGTMLAYGALLYFVYLGYGDGASVMWIFIYPLLAMFMLGIIWGLTTSVITLASALWIMTAGTGIGAYPYSGEFTIRFAISYSLVTAMVLAYEYWRVLLEVQRDTIDLELKSARDALAEFANVCAWCNAVKSPDGSWRTLEEYVSDKEERNVSHSICPDCAHTHKQMQQGQ